MATRKISALPFLGSGSIANDNIIPIVSGSTFRTSIADLRSIFTGSGGGGSTFPFTGSAVITGSLTVTGSSILNGNFSVTRSFGQFQVVDTGSEVIGAYGNLKLDYTGSAITKKINGTNTSTQIHEGIIDGLIAISNTFNNEPATFHYVSAQSGSNSVISRTGYADDLFGTKSDLVVSSSLGQFQHGIYLSQDDIYPNGRAAFGTYAPGSGSCVIESIGGTPGIQISNTITSNATASIFRVLDANTSASLDIKQSYVVLSQVSASFNFANDAAAAAGGVPLGGLYRNGNVISIRLV